LLNLKNPGNVISNIKKSTLFQWNQLAAPRLKRHWLWLHLRISHGDGDQGG
jgi:hypothetical protein